ncbi:MAG: hypothetical protein BGO98_37570 [Myxococcales bacterium 68-20]|nr:hypothetical protein [Myxococcales bacterium]OJY22296.1 MAG: hypothetical protein BGO98_37570 [Myxococcales bacterium 68-20]
MDRRPFRKRADAPDDVIGIAIDLGGSSSEGRIRCPRCRWQPRKSDRWECVCSHLWHAFDTCGRCPECKNQWRETQCLRCAEWSAHGAWYA